VGSSFPFITPSLWPQDSRHELTDLWQSSSVHVRCIGPRANICQSCSERWSASAAERSDLSTTICVSNWTIRDRGDALNLVD
jgi:hypothetical protein